MKSLQLRIPLAFVLCLLGTAGAGVAQTPFGGPEIVLPSCPATAPAAAALEDRELWLWEHGREIDAASFVPGETEPSRRTHLFRNTRSAFRLADNGEAAWVVWEKDGFLEVRRLSPEGDRALVEAQVPAGGLVTVIDLAVAPDGRLLLVWEEITGIGFFRPYTSYALHIDADGAISGDRFSFAVKTETEGSSNPRVEALPNGDFAVFWQTFIGRVPPGAEEVLSPVDIGGWSKSAAWPGGLVVAGRTFGFNPALSLITWQVLGPDFQPIGEARFADGGPTGANGGGFAMTVAAAEDGTLALAWRDGARLSGLLMDSTGAPISEVFRVDATDEGVSDHPDATFDEQGVLTVVWDQAADSPSCASGSGSIRGRRFRADTGCPTDALCLLDDRFAVTVAWDDPFNGGSGVGTPVPVTDDTGTFWFFDDENLELMVKVLDGRPVNGHYWVFFGSLTNVEFELTVRDRVTGAVRTYDNPPFTFASRGDTTAFPAEP